MKTYLDCIPCFFKLGLKAARLSNADETVQKRVINEIAREVAKFPLTCAPPEMGQFIYSTVRKYTGLLDPYLEIKKKSNETALKLYPQMKRRADSSADPLFTAAKLAVAGNVIDYGIPESVDIEKDILSLLDSDFAASDYEEFTEALKKYNSILYIADNAGEIVFHMILIEEMKKISPDMEITVAVRGAPVINDATMEDAKACGLQDVVKVIQNGDDAPGIILAHCAKEFLDAFTKAGLIISKGQGNFETLNGKEKNIFFLFKAKCSCVAQEAGVQLGDICLVSNRRWLTKA
jgi:damage-control phosphatase, subfamily I